MSNLMNTNHILSIMVDNEPGVLARVVGLFSGRGYNIESLSVSEVDADKFLSRVTVVTSGTKIIVDQIKAQLKKLIPVHDLIDITELDSYEERQIFLEDMGLDEPGVSKLIRSAYQLLNLSTYFTAGVKEVRAWTIKEGMKAPQAAGVIHTDFEKGFIRAEVIKYTDFVELGSELACKENGKMSVEGKEYVVADGDIMHFRFNT